MLKAADSLEQLLAVYEAAKEIRDPNVITLTADYLALDEVIAAVEKDND